MHEIFARFIRGLKRASGRVVQLRLVLADPFELLHRYYWSAPWLECKIVRSREN